LARTVGSRAARDCPDEPGKTHCRRSVLFARTRRKAVKINAKRALIVAASLVAAAVSAGAVNASGGGATGDPPAGGATPASSIAITNCKPTKTDFIDNDTDLFDTASPTFVEVPGIYDVVTVGGKKPSCVLVAVSGDTTAVSGEQAQVGVMLDGNLGNPSFAIFSMNDPNAAQEHAALFAFPSVAPGIHNITMVYRSAFGGTVSISRPAMRIDHP
jgi:hypothetical protein